MSRAVIDALVLRHTDYQDSDRIITVFSRDRGRLDGRARGVRKSVKRFAGHLDLFTRVKLTVSEGRGAPRFEGAEVEEAWLGMRADLDRLAWAGALAELTLKLYGEGEAHPAAFDALIHALTHLDTAPELRPGLLQVTELRLLEEGGLAPHLDACVGCGAGIEAGQRFVFHAARGGVLCVGCAGAGGGLAVDVGTLKALLRSLTFPPDRLDRIRFTGPAGEQCRLLVGSFLRYHVGGGWKARRFLEQVQGLAPSAGEGDGER